MDALREQGDLPLPAPIADDPRARLAAEWKAAAPRTDAEIARFYQESRCLGEDLESWHTHPERRAWTDMLVHVAKEIGAAWIIDVGCGAGHDLCALRKASIAAPWCAVLELLGVEPNAFLRRGLREKAITAVPSIDDVSLLLKDADLLICIDVLEHVHDPETFLGDIARRAKVGCVLFETTATFDTTTPLHLRANRGWHPGRVLERYGWQEVDKSSRVRVWRRVAEEGSQRASLLLCAYRSVSSESLTSLLALTAGDAHGWRLRVKTGDALISRSRSIVLTSWYRETNDDVCLMVDDDIVFSPADADHITELCRSGYDVIGGAYPVHDGGHLAVRYFPGTREVRFGPGNAPTELQYAATGFLAIHRRVIDALVQTMPLVHENASWSFYPLFPLMVVDDEAAGGHALLSEDWSFTELARRAGFRVWLDPTVILRHASTIPLSVRNMSDVHDAIGKV